MYIYMYKYKYASLSMCTYDDDDVYLSRITCMIILIIFEEYDAPVLETEVGIKGYIYLYKYV
jgi:hypothetical protein